MKSNKSLKLSFVLILKNPQPIFKILPVTEIFTDVVYQSWYRNRGTGATGGSSAPRQLDLCDICMMESTEAFAHLRIWPAWGG